MSSLHNDSFEQFAADAVGPLLRFARVLTTTEDDAWDLVQDCMLRMATHWGGVRRDGNPMGYARSTLARLNIDRHRQAGRRTRLVDRLRREPQPIPASPGLGFENHVRAAWNQLSPNQRTCLAMRYLEDCDVDTIGQALDCSPQTVRSHLSRGLERLRVHTTLEQDDG